jgi:hypothetical protein
MLNCYKLVTNLKEFLNHLRSSDVFSYSVLGHNSSSNEEEEKKKKSVVTDATFTTR